MALLIAVLLIPVGLVVGLLYAESKFSGMVYPGISVAGTDLSGLKPEEAASRLSQSLDLAQRRQILFKDGEQIWQATPAELGYAIDPVASAVRAYQVGRDGDFSSRLDAQFNAWWSGVYLPPVAAFNQRQAQEYLQVLARQIDKPVLEANLGLNGPEVVVHSGQVGRLLDIPASLQLISEQISSRQDILIPLVIKETPPMVLDASEQASYARNILSSALTLSLPEGQEGGGPWTIEPATLANMLTIEKVQSKYQVVVSAEILRTYLKNLAPSLALTAKNARFTFNDKTKKLEVLEKSSIGRSLDVDASLAAINQKLAEGQHAAQLVLNIAMPGAPDTASGEQLGVTELVTAQTSYFYGSSKERVQNIKAASSRFHGLMVAPGETFSMSNALGDISLDNGYAEALIILGNQTIKGVGGGVCQVSTTLFRTVFYSGFPVKERYAHAYRVSYYEQKKSGAVDPSLAGLDATVFVPLVDFKFTNDTPYWLLMETYVEGYSLTWKFYSTSDGRTVDWKTTGPTNKQPAPDPLYKENPKLAKGEIKQVDWEAEGADITVNRTVSRGGSVIARDTFTTHYQPWRAIYEYGPGTENIPTPKPPDNP